MVSYARNIPLAYCVLDFVAYYRFSVLFVAAQIPKFEIWNCSEYTCLFAAIFVFLVVAAFLSVFLKNDYTSTSFSGRETDFLFDGIMTARLVVPSCGK